MHHVAKIRRRVQAPCTLRLRAFALIFFIALLLPLTAQAAPQTGTWQVYTVAHGLRDYTVTHLAPDGIGGIWAGHFAGGRGIPHFGGLVYLGPDGNPRIIDGEPLTSCPTVLGLSVAPNQTLWMRLGGYFDYNSSDFRGTCIPRYGPAIGFIEPDGTPQMLPTEQLPPDITAGPLTDFISRLWVGTKSGLAVREHDGTWRTLTIWGAQDERGTRVLRSFAFGHGIAVGSGNGGVATVWLPEGQPEQIVTYPRPPADATDIQDLAYGPTGITAIINNRLYQQNLQAGRWDVLEPPAGVESLRSIIYVGERLWIGSLFNGLYRRDPGGWTNIKAGETPLLGGTINEMAMLGNSLYVATDQGLARIDTGALSPDPSQAQRAFDALWERTNRSGDGWVWGPRAWAERYEPNRESPGGTRFVRYYDKGRMELSFPDEDFTSPWYVTSGLLVTEMVRGKVQLGANALAAGCPIYFYRDCPAYVRVAGDQSGDNAAPTYGDFVPLLTLTEPRIGEQIFNLIGDAEGYLNTHPEERALLTTPALTAEVYDGATGHNIPRVFWNYLRDQPGDWLYLFGRPLTEAYWTRAPVGGVPRWVLVQLFERRTLTYTPDNPPGWQVEMGNVGQHYFQWRYYELSNPPPWQ